MNDRPLNVNLLWLALACVVAWWVALAPGPVVQAGPQDVKQQSFGGPVNANTATTGQVLTRQSDGSWVGATLPGSSFGAQTATHVLAGPTPSFRALTSADIPDLSAVYQPLDADLTALAGISGANGDIIIRSGGTWTRLPKGSDTEVLTLASGLPSWAAPAGGSDTRWTTSGTRMYQTTTTDGLFVGTSSNTSNMKFQAVCDATRNSVRFNTVSGGSFRVRDSGTYDMLRLDDSGEKTFEVPGGGSLQVVSAYGNPAYFKVREQDADWKTFSPTTNWATNTTWYGQYRVLGKFLEFHVSAVFTGAPDAGTLEFTLPASLVLDSTTSTCTEAGGHGYNSAASKVRGAFTFVKKSSSVLYVYGSSNSAASEFVPFDKTSMWTIVNTDFINLRGRVPVQ